MHNVQYYLKTLDLGKLEEQFFLSYPIHYEEWATDREKLDLPVGGIREWDHQRFRDYVEKLRNMTPVVRDGKVGCIYSYRYLSLRETAQQQSEMFYPEEGADAENHWALEFEEPEVILGYMVADNALTQLNIYETIADVLFEASFFGYDDEDRRNGAGEIWKDVEEAMKSIDEYYADPNHDPEVLPPMPLEIQIKDSEVREDDPFLNHLKTEAAESPKELALRNRIEELMREYTSLSHQREKEKVVKTWKNAGILP